MLLASDDEFRGTERFVVQRRLGVGAFGVVYEAFDRERGISVALKTLREANVEALYRLKQEFRALTNLAHPNLVALHELLAHDEQWFFTMELVEGVNFLDYVRRGLEPVLPDAPTFPSFEGPLASQPTALSRFVGRPDRLRAALRQAILGIRALHAAGKLHRDIKPSNVLVKRDGRLVLLDFGLVMELTPAKSEASLSFVGTPAYMPPEQGTGVALSEASDWYSLGVMLYEALTGNWPFSGTFVEMMWSKRHSEAPSPRERVPDIPEDLNAICRDLLRTDPLARPTGNEILARLGGVQAATFELAASPTAEARATPFVGREAHLSALHSAFLASREGKAVVVRVHGASGSGKTVLVRRFLGELPRGMVTLSGRCYERESVPYKAFDSLVDALSQYLKRLPPGEVDAILPRDVLALARLFPVLRRVEAVARARRRVLEIPDSQELRRRAFAALRELLGRMADQQDVVLFLDDLQWGDVDSAVLLAELLRPPNPPPLLLIACYRSEETETSPFFKRFNTFQDSSEPADVRELVVGELADSDARDLAHKLLGEDPSAQSDRADAIARVSGGNPFFIDELVRYSQAGVEFPECDPSARRLSAGADRGTALEDVIRSRLDRLPEAARRLLEVLAVAGQPLQAAVAGSAAELTDEEDLVGLLRARHLVRTHGAREGNEIEPYHDRIRETVVADLSPEILKAHHRCLAIALEASGRADPETLALHFQEGGDSERAAEYSAAAAARASEALAFDRAARLYRLALELGVAGNATARRGFRVKLGEALANAGRGAEAAKAYLAAADGAPSATEALELRRRAAEQLLRSGHLDEGLPLLEGVLSRIGLKLAEARWRTLLSFLFHRFLIRLRGLEFRERDASQVSAEELIRVDSCWTLSIGLSNVATLRGRDFQNRHLLLALKAGEPYRVALAIANEAGYSATDGWREKKRTDWLVQKAMALAKRVGRPHAIAMAYMTAGVAAHQEGRWKTAWELAQREEAILRESCTGVAWELDFSHIFSLRALYYLGGLQELADRLPVLIMEAHERDDLLAVTSLRTRLSYSALLAADEPAKARENLREAIEQWSHEGFHSQHYWTMVAEAEIALFLAEAQTAWRLLSNQWRGLKRSQLLRVQLFRIEARHLRARCAIAAAVDEHGRDDPRALLGIAERDATRIEGENTPWGNALAQLLRAGIAGARSDTQNTISFLQSAERDLSSADMSLYAAAARRRRGELLGGDEGRSLVETADTWMAGQGIRIRSTWLTCSLPDAGRLTR